MCYRVGAGADELRCAALSHELDGLKESVCLSEPELDFGGSSLADWPVEQPQHKIAHVGETPRFLDAGSDGFEETATYARVALDRQT